MLVLSYVSAALSAGTAVFGVIALARPQALKPGSERGYYPAMYASRAIPFGLALTIVLVLNAGSPSVVPWLWAAAAAQVGDFLIGVWNRTWGMCLGAGIAGSVFVATALSV